MKNKMRLSPIRGNPDQAPQRLKPRIDSRGICGRPEGRPLRRTGVLRVSVSLEHEESRIPASAGKLYVTSRAYALWASCQNFISSADGPYMPGISISFSRR